MLPFQRRRRIYLDYASAPPVCTDALQAMHAAERLIGNPGAIHHEAVLAKESLEASRTTIARTCGIKARELLFTPGLTAANNLAILGAARSLERTRRTLAGTHWMVSAIEHASVLECFGEVERLGGEVTFLAPDERGVITPESLAPLLKKETVFVSIGWANNELGTVQPLREIAACIAAHENAMGSTVLLHSDAGQAPLYLASTIHSLGVDLFSIGSNKLYGPHGVGALYLSNRVTLANVEFGGAQERALVPGTENVALAAGFAAAVARLAGTREHEAVRLKNLRDDFSQALVRAIPNAVINGGLPLPHMLNISLPEVSSEYVTLALDHAGIAVSTKSACREGEASDSHAVAALGGPSWRAKNTLRFSLGADTRASDLARVVHALSAIVERIRE